MGPRPRVLIRLRLILPQQILDKPLPRGLGRMHRHLARRLGKRDQRRAVACDPPDVKVTMSPRARGLSGAAGSPELTAAGSVHVRGYYRKDGPYVRTHSQPAKEIRSST
jgi:hypothetical protein